MYWSKNNWRLPALSRSVPMSLSRANKGASASKYSRLSMSLGCKSRRRRLAIFASLPSRQSPGTHEGIAQISCQRRAQILCRTLLDGVLKGMAADRAKLLLVLQRPEVPLHNNLSEGHIRDYVKKRKISGSTRSDSGRCARDTFASLKKTCRRLGVNFWEYLQDRVRGLGKVPRLADLIRQKVEEAVARRAPAAPPPDPDGGAGGLNAG